MVAEVPSSSTEAHDHGTRRWAYATIPTLRHYVLIAQDRAGAEVAWIDGEAWRSVFLRDCSASLRLDALGLELPLEEVLAGGDLPSDGNGSAATHQSKT